MTFEIFIAARYLRAKRRQAIIGVITAISIIGVAAGVASLIIALAINNGFRQDLQERLLGSTAHVSLMKVESSGIDDWRTKLEELRKQPHVEAVAPAIYEQVLVSRGARAKGVILKGVIPDEEERVGTLLNHVKFGSADALKPDPRTTIETPSGLAPIIIGADLAKELGASVGSILLVTSPQGELT